MLKNTATPKRRILFSRDEGLYSLTYTVQGVCEASIKSRRADSYRLPLLQLRVITQALQGFAGGCKSRISKRLSLLWLAACCTVLRSRWYQSGVRSTSISA